MYVKIRDSRRQLTDELELLTEEGISELQGILPGGWTLEVYDEDRREVRRPVAVRLRGAGDAQRHRRRDRVTRVPIRVRALTSGFLT